MPIFFQGSQLRLSALIDDLSPVTFTWVESGGNGIVLTRTAAEAAGLNVPANAPRQSVSRAAGEQMTARRIARPVTTRTCPDCLTEGHDADARFCKHCGKPLPAYHHD